MKRSPEIAHIGSWEYDLVQNQLTWSDEVYRIFGLQPQEFTATYEAFLALVHPDDRAAVDDAYTRSVRENRDSYEIEHRVLCKDTGDIRIVHEKCEHVRDNDSGTIIRSVGMVHDITERKLVENALAVSETRYRRLFETAQDGILLLDAHTGRITDVNPFLLEMLGYSHQEMVGRRLWEIGAFQDVDASRNAFKELQTERYIRYEDLPLQTATGEQIAVEFVSNVYLVDGQQIIQCNIRDITQRRQVEYALQQLNVEMQTVLEVRVQERTAELAGVIEELRLETLERLRAEEKERVSLVEERTRMAREIHDTLAQGFTGIIIQLEAAEDVLYEDVDAMRAHMQRARTLARESLVEARRSVWALRPRMLEGGNMIAAFTEMVKQFPHNASVTLDFSYDGEPCPLPSDMEHDLLRIGQEAINNAVKYAAARHIRVTLTFDDRQVTLSIEDDGQGFNSSQQRQHGFGLLIMAERTERHGGKLAIASQPGHGTCIQAVTPLRSDDEKGIDYV